MSNRSAVSERGIIYLALILIYLIFVVTAYVHAPFLWGINFLYYLPAWQKLCFIIAGGIIFIPSVNALIFKCITILFRFEFRQMGLGSKIFLLFMASLVMVSFLYILRVTPIYHDSLNAIYFINRNVSFADYVTQTVYGFNKPLLYGFNALLKFILKTKLGLSPFYTLFYSSIFLGLVYIALTIGIANLFNFPRFQKAFSVILLSTQAISLYYFGYGNFYAILPISILLYLFFLVLYFRSGISFLFPIAAGIIAMGVHAGLIFILPSMLFIVIHRLRRPLTSLYALFSFSFPKRSLLIFTALLLCGYVILKSGAVPLLQVQNALVSFATDPELKYGFKILSPGYFVHLINVMLLISPVGMILFFVLIKNIHAVMILGELKYALLWMALGGLAMIVFLSPQTLYAWDIYGWMSAAIVLLGSFLYAFYSQQLTRYSHLTTVLLVHSTIYFLAWICMNSNVYAAIMNYLDSVPAKFENQIAVCIDAANLTDIDRNSYFKLLKILEEKANSKEDYSAILSGYGTIADSQNYNRLYTRVKQMYLKAVEEEPDKAYNYYQLYTRWDKNERYDPAKRDFFEPFYTKPIELEPSNLTYYMEYAFYLNYIRDDKKAYSYFLIVDSLYCSRKISYLNTPYTSAQIKYLLAIFSYKNKNFLKTLQYFSEAQESGGNVRNEFFKDALERLIRTYAVFGNLNKAQALLARYRQYCQLDMNELQESASLGKPFFISQMIDLARSRNFRMLDEYLIPLTDNNNDPDYLIFKCISALQRGEPDSLIMATSLISQENAAYPYVDYLGGIGYVLKGQHDSAYCLLNKTAFDTLQTIRISWLDSLVLPYVVEYMASLARNPSIPDSVRRCLGQHAQKLFKYNASGIYADFYETGRLMKMYSGGDYVSFLKNLDKPGSTVYKTIDSLYDIEVMIGGQIYQHVQSLLLQNQIDSLGFYSRYMIQLAPESFQGYLLAGIYSKYKGRSREAAKYFDNAIELVPRSKLISDHDAVIRRIQEVRGNE